MRHLRERDALCPALTRRVEALESSMAAVTGRTIEVESRMANVEHAAQSPAKTNESARDEDSDDDALMIADAPISSGSFEEC